LPEITLIVALSVELRPKPAADGMRVAFCLTAAEKENTMHADGKICHVRDARLADLDAMVLLLAELFTIESDFYADPAAQRSGLKMLFDRPADARIIVAESGGEVVGMCAVHKRISTFAGCETCVLEDLVVKEGFRRRGVGAQLLNAAERCAREMGWRHMQLLMDRDNLPAERFYLARGWCRTRLVCMRQS
jgi:N-acetylglutamate synthase-like GNAT family acetyltransferase